MKRLRFELMDINGLGFIHGVYVVFEKGESAHGYDRIVYIGTTTGKKTPLAGRLTEHYQNEGRSVFRNEVALCLLKKNGDPSGLSTLFFKDSIYRNKWKKTASQEQLEKYREINEDVSEFLRKSCSFIAFPVDEADRVYWEEKLISTISSCTDCSSSKNWLGNYAPDKKAIIRTKGLWNIKGVNNKELITYTELAELEQMVEMSRKKYG
jgi:hypothetical protein